jgi:hypothetical protein
VFILTLTFLVLLIIHIKKVFPILNNIMP